MPEQDTSDAEERARPFWSGTLSFGLVSIPVDLVPAQRTSHATLRQLDADGTPLARRYYCPSDETEVEPDHIVRGYELDIRLPLFDWGATRRASLDARSLAAANRYEALARAATSQARESYFAYRTAYDQAKHQRDEMVPLRRTISEENLLRYNGMLIGVFELLADAREQVTGVIAAIEAHRDFWLADVALAATLVGKPIAMGAGAAPPGAALSAGGAAAH